MKIYAGNLSYDIHEEDLNNVFSEHGQVDSVSIITDKFTGKSKGFGFIEMSNDDEAKAAIEALNGKEVEGRALNVSEARPKKSFNDRGPRSGGFGGRSNRDRNSGGYNSNRY